MLLTGCARETAAPIQSRALYLAPRSARYWMVAPGDTLYSIAWANNLDYRTLARWNGIPAPYRLRAGARLRLSAPKGGARRVRPVPRVRPPAYQAARAAPAQTAVRRWIWPAAGVLIGSFQPRDGHKGINIAGTAGAAVVAAAAGRVVYAGSGLRGYGALIILKHNNKFLSAYAHNSHILVAEGTYVRQGQRIADMGSSGTSRVMLHFEIRLRGHPVDPLNYLPRRQ